MTQTTHITVLLEEAVNALVTDPAGLYIDGTFGRGGHSRRILEQLSDRGRLVGVDRDPEAVAVGNELEGDDARFSMEHSSFSGMGDITQRDGLVHQVQGILLDLGVSSPQLDNADRGFSFLRDGPLDMRMNPNAGVSAEVWVNSSSEEEMVSVFKTYGEERFARRIARSISEQRQLNPITNTLRLADIVAKANPKWERDKHPATRVFQAIRIHVNDELGELETVLQKSVQMLAPGGRLVVISFHSLEDRVVKRFLKNQAKGESFPRELPVTMDMINPKFRLLGKAIKASAEEVAMNPRSRSAVMRIGERLAEHRGAP